MKYIFFGTPEFAAIILEKLITAGFPPAVVVCNPDRPVGRKRVITPPPTKIVAQKYEIKVWQPESLMDLKAKNPAENGAFVETSNDSIIPRLVPNNIIANHNKLSSHQVDILQNRGPTGNRTPEPRVPTPGSNHSGPTADLLYQKWDFFVVAAYSKILPKEIINLPRLGTIGVHPSLLPKYRGATPIQTAILDGATETGVTLFLLDEKVDHGPILAQRELAISNSQFLIPKLTYAQLLNKLAELGADLLVKTLPDFIKGNIKPHPQNEAEATYTKKFVTEDGYVDLEKDDPVTVERKIRALNPEPGVYTIKAGKRIKIIDENTIQFEGKKPVRVAYDKIKQWTA